MRVHWCMCIFFQFWWQLGLNFSPVSIYLALLQSRSESIRCLFYVWGYDPMSRSFVNNPWSGWLINQRATLWLVTTSSPLHPPGLNLHTNLLGPSTRPSKFKCEIKKKKLFLHWKSKTTWKISVTRYWDVWDQLKQRPPSMILLGYSYVKFLLIAICFS